jgi:hypothetical protein
VEEELDLTPIKFQWAEKWNELKCIQLGFEQLKDESDNAFDRRKQITAQHFSRDDIMTLAKDEISHHGGGPIPPSSRLWATLPPGATPQGLHLTSHLNANLIESHPDARNIVAQIIFRTLSYLADLSTTDPRAAGAANSIWHSLRTDSIRANPAGDEQLPDSVGPSLFTHPDVLRDAFATLQLDRTSTSTSYRQLWFLDRIMAYGTLWVGRYLPAPAGCIRLPPRENRPKLNDSMNTILGRQMALQFLSSMLALQAGYDDDDGRQRLPNEHTAVNVSSLTYFAYLNSRDTWSGEADERRARELVAVFDVDGPCTVATPFVPDWEMLPRPGIRGMSVCWVVEGPVVTGEKDG